MGNLASRLLVSAVFLAFSALSAHSALVPFLATVGKSEAIVTITGNCRNAGILDFRICDGYWAAEGGERHGTVRGSGLPAAGAAVAVPVGDTAHLPLSTWNTVLSVGVPPIWLLLAVAVFLRRPRTAPVTAGQRPLSGPTPSPAARRSGPGRRGRG